MGKKKVDPGDAKRPGTDFASLSELAKSLRDKKSQAGGGATEAPAAPAAPVEAPPNEPVRRRKTRKSADTSPERSDAALVQLLAKEMSKSQQAETEKKSKKGTEKKSEKETEKKSEKETVKKSEKETEKKSKNDTEKKSEKETDKKSEKDTEKKSKKDTEKKSEKETEKKSEKETDKKSEKDTEKKPEKETKKKSEKETEKKSKNETEKKSEKETEKKSEKQMADLGKRKDFEIAAELDEYAEKKRKSDGVPDLRRGKSKEISVEELLEADQFSPSALPFTLSWEGYQQLKDFYHLTDSETTTILLAMVGPKEAGRKYWSQYKIPFEIFNENGVLQVPKSNAVEPRTPILDKNQQNKLALPATAAKRKTEDVETSSTGTTTAVENEMTEPKWKRFCAPPPEALFRPDAEESESSEEETLPGDLGLSGFEEMEIDEESEPVPPATWTDQASFTARIVLGFLCASVCLRPNPGIFLSWG